MPHSHPFGKEWAGDLFAVTQPRTVLDVGAGAGMWVDALRHRAPEPQRWLALEVWEPYVERYGLAEKYDMVVVDDVRQARLPDVDLAIAGDVLEHISQLDAEILVTRLLHHARHVLISVPVVHYDQGIMEGNPFETHLWHPTHEWAMDVLRPNAWVKGDVVGAYWRCR